MISISITFLAFTYVTAASRERRCVWYGECHTSAMDSRQYCRYNGPPKALDQSSEAWKKFLVLCPRLVGKAKKFGLCCDSAMIETYSHTVAMAKAVLGRCPSCYHNMLNLWCQLGCSPHQAQFVKVRKTAYNAGIGASYVTKVRYFVSKYYGNKFFDSCKGVRMQDGTAILSLMCGKKAVGDCTAKDWLKTLGDNKYSPFITKFSIVGRRAAARSRMVPMNDHVVACNEKVDPNGRPCPCYQCAASCTGRR